MFPPAHRSPARSRERPMHVGPMDDGSDDKKATTDQDKPANLEELRLRQLAKTRGRDERFGFRRREQRRSCG
jgi:hypothetical protein